MCLDFDLFDLCGNVGMCLVKFDVGDYDVILLVCVGLEWLGLGGCICSLLVVLDWLFVLG